MAALEGGVAALALASGQACYIAVQNICHAGENFAVFDRHLWRDLESVRQ